MAINEYAFDLDEALAAARRWEAHPEHHQRFARAVRTGDLSQLDTAGRRAKRTSRLLSKLRESAPEAAAAVLSEAIAPAAVAGAAFPGDLSEFVQERVIGKSADFMFVEFFELGIQASRAVARIVTDLGGGRRGFGTGFMVSPNLLLTNHHVLPSPPVAARSVVEFNYQRDRSGRELSKRVFQLNPSRFFLQDKALDFTLVAVGRDADLGVLGEFGWCPLIREEGKIVEGEPINIVQHPQGELKQVVIRENRLIQLLDVHAHYEADTLPGSSGSPVFNAQWEVVALHHSAVPCRNEAGEPLRIDGEPWRKGVDLPSMLDWVANEGIRISCLMQFVGAADVKEHERALRDELMEAEVPPAVERSVYPVPAVRPTPAPLAREDAPMSQRADENSVSVTIPLHITVSLGAPVAGGVQAGVSSGTPVATAKVRGEDADVGRNSNPGTPPEASLEKVEPDPSDPGYANRPGYDPAFLGFDAPFPSLTNATRSKAFALPGGSGDEKYQLKYHHFSVVLNKARKLAFVAGVNYDPTARVHHPRDKDGDRWYFDPRVSRSGEHQAGEALYADNPLDRGHLVRRADAGWGETPEEAKLANDDTFHFTNCSPQHAITNQGKTGQAPTGLKLWGSLEEHVARQGKKEKRRLSIFNGPVFRPSDRPYRGVKIPDEFWKVVVFADDQGQPAAAAFVLTQAELIEGLEEAFEAGEYRSVQVRVRDLEERTELDFGPFVQWDVLAREGAEESFADGTSVVLLESLDQVVL